MTIDPQLIKDARDWLDQLFEDLGNDPLYMKSGEDLLRRMEWEICRYDREHFNAIKAALGYWIRSDDEAKVSFGLDLIGDLEAVEHLSEVENLRDDLKAGTSRWPSLWLSFVEAVLARLREAQQRKREPAGDG